MSSVTGNGYVCNTYFGNTPYPVDIVRMFNFGNEICERYVLTGLLDSIFGFYDHACLFIRRVIAV